MAVNTNISQAAAQAAVDAVVDLIDGGTATGVNPKLTIYDGSQPGSPDDAVGTQTKLVEIDLGAATVFGAAGTGTGNSAVATASGVLTKTGTATNASPSTGTWFRVTDKDGTAVIDGSVDTASADLELNNTSIASGQQVKLTSWAVKMATGET
jgi:hypothetical protein